MFAILAYFAILEGKEEKKILCHKCSKMDSNKYIFRSFFLTGVGCVKIFTLLLFIYEDFPHPVRHVVCVGPPVVVVEDHDGGHHGARHHEHDAVEVGPYQRTIRCYRYNL